MDDKVKHIIDSGLLEAYFLGLTSEEQTKEIDIMLQSNDQLKDKQQAFDTLLLDLTDAISKEPPPSLKSQIKDKIKPKPHLQSVLKEEKKPFNYWLILPIILGGLLLWTAYSNFKMSKELNEELIFAKNELNKQRLENKLMSEQMMQLVHKYEFINEATTDKFILKGNSKAADLKIVAYWNEEKKMSALSVEKMSSLPAGKCLQMWADVDGKMISVGIIDKETKFADIDFLENAESLNVTIEPQGGSDHPNVSQLVANVLI